MDANWLKALTLPTKTIVGLFGASSVALAADALGMLDLSSLANWVRTSIILAAILFGCLLVSEAIFHSVATARKRAEAKVLEERTDQDHRRAVKELDNLSWAEKVVLAKAIKGGSRSITERGNSVPAGHLIAKGILKRVPGEFHSLAQPYLVEELVWDALTSRKDYFAKVMEKHKENEARRQANNRRERSRRIARSGF